MGMGCLRRSRSGGKVGGDRGGGGDHVNDAVTVQEGHAAGYIQRNALAPADPGALRPPRLLAAAASTAITISSQH